MINLKVAAVPDFSVYDMDTFSKDLCPDFEPLEDTQATISDDTEIHTRSRFCYL